jgi:hypothetical protein
MCVYTAVHVRKLETCENHEEFFDFLIGKLVLCGEAKIAHMLYVEEKTIGIS